VDEFIAYLNIMELWILELESELMIRSWRSEDEEVAD
jgi:hypothetical protein